MSVSQRLEMVRRIADEIEGFVVELGTDGRLLALQLDEMLAGVEEDRGLLVRDYLPGGGRRPRTIEQVLTDLRALIGDRAARPVGRRPLLRAADVARRAGLPRQPARLPAARPGAAAARRASSTGWSTTSAGCRSCWPPRSRTCSPSRASARPGPAASARACPGWPRPRSSTATAELRGRSAERERGVRRHLGVQPAAQHVGCRAAACRARAAQPGSLVSPPQTSGNDDHLARAPGCARRRWPPGSSRCSPTPGCPPRRAGRSPAAPCPGRARRGPRRRWRPPARRSACCRPATLRRRADLERDHVVGAGRPAAGRGAAPPARPSAATGPSGGVGVATRASEGTTRSRAGDRPPTGRPVAAAAAGGVPPVPPVAQGDAQPAAAAQDGEHQGQHQQPPPPVDGGGQRADRVQHGANVVRRPAGGARPARRCPAAGTLGPRDPPPAPAARRPPGPALGRGDRRLVRRRRPRPAVAPARHRRRGRSWSARSCCSRRRSPGWSRSGGTGWPAGRPPPTLAAATPGRRHPGVGQARLPAPGAAAARGRGRDRRSGTAAWCPTTSPRWRRCRASAPTPPGRSPASATGSRSRWWTPTSAGWSPGWCTAGRRPAPPGPRTWPTSRRSRPPTRPGRSASRWPSWSSGRWSAWPARPRCGACPVRRPVRLAAGRLPRRTTGRRGGCRSSPAPTGRCAGGCSTSCGRRTSRSPAAALDGAWADAVQRSRCLDSLLDRRPGRADPGRPVHPPAADIAVPAAAHAGCRRVTSGAAATRGRPPPAVASGGPVGRAEGVTRLAAAGPSSSPSAPERATGGVSGRSTGLASPRKVNFSRRPPRRRRPPR